MTGLAIRALFAATVATAAALVFLVQPMVAKQLLPTFGGTPAVWNTAVVFFQTALLAGYAIAHVSLRRLGPRRQVPLQLALSVLVLAFVPFSVRASEQPPQWAPPAAWVVLLLALAVGLPYLAVTTASPVLQRWYAALGLRDSRDPYFLYAASNAGSLAGLLAFPFLLEPRLSTDGQERAWAIAFVAYLLGLAACAVLVRRRGHEPVAAGTNEDEHGGDADGVVAQLPAIGRWRALRWVLLAAVPSSLMLGVTTFITTDVASAPLLWVVPLALYLVSFMVTFGRVVHVPPRPAGLVAAAVSVLLVLVELDRIDVDELELVLLHLAAMFTAAVLAHSLLYADRPPARQLTGFFLLVSVGGAIGGAFTALAAPALFEDVYEYPLLLAAVFLLRPALWEGPRPWREATWFRAPVLLVEIALATLVALVLGAAAAEQASFELRLADDTWFWACVAALALLAVRRWGMFVALAGVFVLLAVGGEDDSVHAERNFFGTLRVERDAHSTTLLHGTTLHGTQLRDEQQRRVPTTYYTTLGPLGDVFDRLQRDEPFVEVGVVGLGAGTVLGHARLWQRFTFFEIDPKVIRVARDPKHFTWVSDADVEVRIIEGDARLELGRGDVGPFDLLVLDAYSSDAVPVHLLTVEAFERYLERLAPNGAMVLHISSRHLALEPIVAANAARLGLAATTRDDPGSRAEYLEMDGNGSHWIALARTPGDLAALREDGRWRTLVAPDPDGPWTDDHSDVAGTIVWLPDWLR